MANNFHDVILEAVIEETSKAKSLVFDIPTTLQETFQYNAGQYLTLKFVLDGEEIRRSYSLSSAPTEKKWRVCVKRVVGGKVSNHICDNLKAGDTISLMQPEGRFVFKADPERQADYYLFAAGSGVTPIISIAKEILEEEPLSTVHMMYGNMNEEEVIYNTELIQLSNKFSGQFHIKNVYSDKIEKKGLFGSMFKKVNPDIPFLTGQISKDTIKKFFTIYPIKNPQKTHAFICGPGSMNENTKEILIKNSLLKGQVHFESFGTTDSGAKAEINSDMSIADVIVELNGEEIPLKIDGTVTVLEALLNAGYDPPHSCSSGACSSCIAKLKEGKVTMDVTHALDEDDITDGYILTCQARVDSEKVIIKYE